MLLRVVVLAESCPRGGRCQSGACVEVATGARSEARRLVPVASPPPLDLALIRKGVAGRSVMRRRLLMLGHSSSSRLSACSLDIGALAAPSGRGRRLRRPRVRCLTGASMVIRASRGCGSTDHYVHGGNLAAATEPPRLARRSASCDARERSATALLDAAGSCDFVVTSAPKCGGRGRPSYGSCAAMVCCTRHRLEPWKPTVFAGSRTPCSGPSPPRPRRRFRGARFVPLLGGGEPRSPSASRSAVWPWLRALQDALSAHCGCVARARDLPIPWRGLGATRSSRRRRVVDVPRVSPADAVIGRGPNPRIACEGLRSAARGKPLHRAAPALPRAPRPFSAPASLEDLALHPRRRARILTPRHRFGDYAGRPPVILSSARSRGSTTTDEESLSILNRSVRLLISKPHSHLA